MQSESGFVPRILWVDPSISALDLQHLRARHLTVHQTSSFEEALAQMHTWAPHLLILEYTMIPSSMHYETFVYKELPLVDPYRVGGQLANNSWRYQAIPIVLATGGLPSLVPGYVVPHLIRVAHFLPKPCAPDRLAQLVLNLLPYPVYGLVIDLVRAQVEVQGVQYSLSSRELAMLAALAQCYPRPCTAAQLGRHLTQTTGLSASETSVRTTIMALRRKLEPNPPRPHYLCNEGQGYFLSHSPVLRQDL